MASAATYVGVGEGARGDVARWALDRRPGDGKTTVADVPSVQPRLGRLDAGLRAARIVVLDVARRWDAAIAAADAAGQAAAAGDVALAKLVATRSAVDRSTAAHRRRPGFRPAVSSAFRTRGPGHQPAARGRGADGLRTRSSTGRVRDGRPAGLSRTRRRSTSVPGA
jgi:alkylation response protein AidB-like acyl-CoA dehydrogenase